MSLKQQLSFPVHAGIYASHVSPALQKLGQPIQERYAEAEERPKAFEELGKQIQQYMKFVEAYKTKVVNLSKRHIFKVCTVCIL